MKIKMCFKSIVESITVVGLEIVIWCLLFSLAVDNKQNRTGVCKKP